MKIGLAGAVGGVATVGLGMTGKVGPGGEDVTINSVPCRFAANH